MVDGCLLVCICSISSSHLFSANETYPRCSGVFSTVLVVRSQYYPLPNQLCDTDTQMVLYECQTAESTKVMFTSEIKLVYIYLRIFVTAYSI